MMKFNRVYSSKTTQRDSASVVRGFTLIELLIVIGILAVLAVVIVLVLNPAQLLAQARDSQRISDLGSVKSAIGLYLSTVDIPVVGAAINCTVTGCTTPFDTGGVATVNNSTLVDGTGWVNINLTGATGGSPLGSLPLDPTNSGNYYYAYKGDATNKTFEIDARLESTKSRGLMTTDGGNKNTCSTFVEATCWYEIGTDPGLDL